jgi:hypothetical protein
MYFRKCLHIGHILVAVCLFIASSASAQDFNQVSWIFEDDNDVAVVSATPTVTPTATPSGTTPIGMSGLVAYWDAQDSGSITVDGSNRVAQINDLSGNGWTLTQANDSYKPVLTTASGRTTLVYDKVDDILSNAGDVFGTGDLTVVVMMSPLSLGEGNSTRILSNGKLLYYYNTDSTLGVRSNGSGTSFSATTTANSAMVTAFTRASSLVNFYINGTLSGTADQNPGAPSSGTPSCVGNNSAQAYTFDGGIGAVAIFNRALSTAERNGVEIYFKNRFAVP